MSCISPIRATTFALCLLAGPAWAQTPAASPQATAAPPPSWFSAIKFSAQSEAGVTFNPEAPSDGLNFGHLFTDRANQLVLNQLLLTAQRPLDPKDSGFQIGFDLQLLYGTDARYTHFLGELNYLTNSRYQLTILNANVQAHLPWLTSGGIDLKVGQYPTPLGYEVIDPSANPFYSHSYIFNFGVPFEHTGGAGDRSCEQRRGRLCRRRFGHQHLARQR